MQLPIRYFLGDLDLVGLWGTKFLKVLGKFGRNLTTSIALTYHQIASVSPNISMVYRKLTSASAVS